MYNCVICGCATEVVKLGVGECAGKDIHRAEFRVGKHLLCVFSGELCLVLINTTNLYARRER
jgi:hypothetical protein